MLGNQVDELLTASAQQLIGQAQLALKLLDWLLIALDFFVEIDEVRSWVWDVANEYRVTVTAADGTTSELPAYAALVMHLAGADISGPCVKAFGWTDAGTRHRCCRRFGRRELPGRPRVLRERPPRHRRALLTGEPGRVVHGHRTRRQRTRRPGPVNGAMTARPRRKATPDGTSGRGDGYFGVCAGPDDERRPVVPGSASTRRSVSRRAGRGCPGRRKRSGGSRRGC